MNGTIAAVSSPGSLFFSPATSKPNAHYTSHASVPSRISIKSSGPTYRENTVRKFKPSSLYEVLRVSRNATPEQIKSAYRNLAKTCHPDASSQPSDGRDFIEINKAYLTLSDPASRALYDTKLGAGKRGSGGYSGRVAVEQSGFSRAVRRWETDQCW